MNARRDRAPLRKVDAGLRDAVRARDVAIGYGDLDAAAEAVARVDALLVERFALVQASGVER